MSMLNQTVGVIFGNNKSTFSLYNFFSMFLHRIITVHFIIITMRLISNNLFGCKRIMIFLGTIDNLLLY